MTGPALVLVERRPDDGAPRDDARLLLVFAARLGVPEAVLCGPADDASLELLGRWGATRVHTCAAPELDRFPAVAHAEVLTALVRRLSARAVLIPCDGVGREIAARLAVRLEAGLVTDAVDVQREPDGIVVTQAACSDAYLIESVVRRGVPVVAVRPDAESFHPTPIQAELPCDAASDTAPRQHPRVAPVTGVRFTAAAFDARLVSRVPATAAPRPALREAEVVVAGGRGLGSPHGFALLGQVADALGGAVGCSHTAGALGWCPTALEVGQTGAVIRPGLYLAGGISGSVRHRAGIRGAHTVVAIDRDPAAPIFQVADFGVVGDVHQVLTALLAEIRQRKARSSPAGRDRTSQTSQTSPAPPEPGPSRSRPGPGPEPDSAEALPW